MSPLSWLWLIGGLIAVVVVHELTHVAIARAYGHRLVCVAINPIGVAVVFEDVPNLRYWLLQVALPAVSTWLMSVVWLFGVFGYLGPSIAAPMRYDPLVLAIIITVLSVLTSGGDIAACVMERRRPLWGDDRILRDLRVLRKLPGVVLFTAHGQRWKDIWRGLNAPEPAGLEA